MMASRFATTSKTNIMLSSWFRCIYHPLKQTKAYTTCNPLIKYYSRSLIVHENLRDRTFQQNSRVIDVVVHASSIRTFGRKAGRMGQHLQKLDEVSHRVEHNNAQEKRQNKNSSGSAPSRGELDDLISDLEEDEEEAIFNRVEFDDDSDEHPSLPSVDDVERRMMKIVCAMEDSFRSIRGAEPTPDLFDSLQVKAYGETVALNAVAQVVITSPTQASITCFDPETAPSVRDAVRDMGMNFNPLVEEGAVIVPIPRVSSERRKAIVKQLGKTAESTRQRVRRIRRGAQDVVKKGKDGNLGPGISKDDAFRVGKEVDSATEKCIQALNDVLEKKQDSVLVV